MHADMLLHNGCFITVSEQQPFASALAIKDGRLVKVGDYDEVYPLLGDNTKVIDLAGKTAVPGFIDSHIHVISLGLGMQVIDLSGVTSKSGILAILSRSAGDTPQGN